MTAVAVRHAEAAGRRRGAGGASVTPAGSGALGAAAERAARRPRVRIGDLTTEAGAVLPDVEVAYETWGELAPDGSNAVVVLHALTGDAHVAANGLDPEPGWWEELVGPGRAVDTRRWHVIAPDIVGGCGGSTGPSSPAPDGRPWGSRFPFLTLRDTVEAERRLLEALGVTAVQAVIGGSMGGARAIEWAVSHPDLVRGVGVLASTAASSADQIAWAQAQVQAIRLDPAWRDGDYDDAGPVAGLGLARRIAHATYRTAAELDHRFGRAPQGEEDPLGTAVGERAGRYRVESYLDHQAAKLTARFDARAYVTVTEALMSHDVGRGRDGVEAALRRFAGRAFVAAVSTDRLYLPAESERLASGLPGEPPVHVIDAPIGHDGFLTEYGQVADALRVALAL